MANALTINMGHFKAAFPLVDADRKARLNRAETDSEFQRRMALNHYNLAQQQRNMAALSTVVNSAGTGAALGGPLGALAGIGMTAGSLLWTTGESKAHGK